MAVQNMVVQNMAVQNMPVQNMAVQNLARYLPSDPRMGRLQPIIDRYEMTDSVTQRLKTLEECEIVVLVDDSGSMNMPLQGTNETRWDEMKKVS